LKDYCFIFAGYTQKGTGHPETKHCPPTFCLVGVMNIWSRSSWLRRRKRSWRKLHSQEALMASSTLHPIRRHVKWKMAHTKKTGEMTTEATKEIAEKIVSHFQLTIRIIFQYFVNVMYNCVFSVQDSFEEQATQGSFVPHGHQDVLTAAIGCPKHPGRVRATGASVTIKQ